MKRYLNKQTRADYIILCHFVTFIERVMKWRDFGVINDAELEKVTEIHKLGLEIVETIQNRMDNEYKDKTIRDMNDTELLILTKVRSSIRRAEIKEEEKKMVISEDDLFGLAEEALTHCKGCIKEEYQKCIVRNCAMELHLPAADDEAEGCQYKF